MSPLAKLTKQMFSSTIGITKCWCVVQVWRYWQLQFILSDHFTASGNCTAGTIPIFGGEKYFDLCMHILRTLKYDEDFSGHFWGFEHPKLRGEDQGFLTQFWCEISPRNVGGANVSVLHACKYGNLQKRGQNKPLANPHHISRPRVWKKNCSVRQLLQAAWFQLHASSDFTIAAVTNYR